MSDTIMPADGNWTSRPPLRHARAGLGAVAVDGRILAVGGFSNDVTFDVVESRRLSGAGRWRDASPMPTPRDNFGIAVWDGRVYAIGGITPDVETDVVEIYDPTRDRWTTGPALPEPNVGASAAVLDGLLYVAGGNVDGATDQVLVLDLKKKGWRSVAPMPTPRFQLRLVASGRYLYAIGGRAPSPSLTTMERYDPRSDSWRALNPMHEGRAAPGVVATRIRSRRVLVVVAGAVVPTDGSTPSGRRTTEVFDVESGRWRLLDALLPAVRGSLGSAIDGDGAILAIGGATRVGDEIKFLRDVDALVLQ